MSTDLKYFIAVYLLVEIGVHLSYLFSDKRVEQAYDAAHAGLYKIHELVKRVEELEKKQ